MVPPDAKLTDLLELARQGNQDAAERILADYGEHIFRAVRWHLPPRLRRHFDSIDIVQDVCKSFFTRTLNKQTFDSPEHLLKTLAGMARNKVLLAARSRFGRHQADRARELALADLPEEFLPANGATPSANLTTQDEWAAFLRAQAPRDRRIFYLFREGTAPADIARELEVSERTVYRVLSKVIRGSQTDDDAIP